MVGLEEPPAARHRQARGRARGRWWPPASAPCVAGGLNDVARGRAGPVRPSPALAERCSLSPCVLHLPAST